MFEEDITNMMLNSFENTADMQVSDNRMKLNKKTHLVSPHDLSALKVITGIFILTACRHAEWSLSSHF